jgi:exopolysaccharide biosynthesis polyprenyl glycosylphosphotransferase
MVVRTVAIDRDVRAPRWLPSVAQLSSADGLRRVFSVLALMAVDCCSIVLAALVVPPVTGFGWVILWPGESWWDVLIAGAVLVAASALKGLYGRRYTRHSARKILSAWTLAFVATLVFMLVVDPVGIGARYVVAWLMAGAFAVSGRYAFDAVVAAVYGTDGDSPPALLVGTLASCRSALTTLAVLPPEHSINVVGLVVAEGEHEAASSSGELPPIVAGYADLGNALTASGANQVILADPASINGQLHKVMECCRAGGVALKVVSLGLQPDGEAVAYIPGLDCPLFAVRPQPAGAASYLIKQTGDRVGSAFLLAVLSPLILLIAALIKSTSRGPVFFVEERIGVGQRPFRCYKFRTMVENARETQGALEELNEADGVLFKLRDDPRITRVGRVLRRLSLDEMPQLFNVLKGDMSLVGPRPLPLRDCELMESWHRRRHVMLPGITGLWQVSGRSDLSFDDMVRLDLQYMETWSLKSDLHIMWRTAGAVVSSRGAY